MSEIVPSGLADFEGHKLDVYEADGRRWFRGSQLENPLGFIGATKGVQNLYARNKAEFDDTMTRVLRIRTGGGVQDTRCYSAEGCYLLAMLAQTPTGARFRRFVVDLIAGRAVILPLDADGRLLSGPADGEPGRYAPGAEVKLLLKELLDVADDPAAVRGLIRQMLDGRRPVRLDAGAQQLVEAYQRLEVMREMVNRAAGELAKQCRTAGYSFFDIKHLYRVQRPLSPDHKRRLAAHA